MNHQNRTSKLIVSAAILFSIVIASSCNGNNKEQKDTSAAQEKNSDSTTGAISRSTATLTLSDGRKIPLDAKEEKPVATEGGCEIAVKNGKLTYTLMSDNGAAALNHKLSVPKGNRFELVLSDGTNIVLNAVSEISYPVSLKRDRQIKFVGEAYFDIPKGDKPFIILSSKGFGAIAPSGSFNINAYPGARGIIISSIKDSIAPYNPSQASVQNNDLNMWQNSYQGYFVKEGSALQIISPYELKASKVNETQTLAWKNNRFGFDYMTLPEAMNEITRWYDIDEVEYINEPPYFDYTEIPSRDTPLPQLLKLLESAGANFRLEKNDRRVVVFGEKPKE